MEPIEVREALSSRTLAQLDELKGTVLERLEELKVEAQSLANQKAALTQGNGDWEGFPELRDRIEKLSLVIVNTEVHLAEMDHARMIARRAESDKRMIVYQKAIDVEQEAVNKAEEKLRAAKAPFWMEHNNREIYWKEEEKRVLQRFYEARQKQRLLMDRAVISDNMPPPSRDFLEALGAGRVRAFEDALVK